MAREPIGTNLDWRPNWRDSRQYNAHRTLLQWRWEFLRRRADFATEWQKSNQSLEDVIATQSELVAVAKGDDPQRAWNARAQLARMAYGDAFRAFGLIDALNPAKDYSHSDLQSFFVAPEWGAPLDVQPGEVAEAYRRGVVVVAFDLRYDLTDQLRLTKQMLLDERRSSGVQQTAQRIHAETWRRYLRTIDAEDAGVTLAEIGAVVLEHSDLDYNERAARAAQCRTDARNLQAKLTA